MLTSQKLRNVSKLTLVVILVWGVLQIIVLISLVVIHFRNVEDDISSYVRDLERLVVSRNSQNFGFMQSLAMVADIRQVRSVGSFADFARNLHARHRQISGIAWYEIDQNEKIRANPVVQVPTDGQHPISKSGKLAEALTKRHGQVQAVVDSRTPNRYFLLEHVHNFQNHFSVVIEIDAREMLKPSLIENCPKVTWTAGDVTFFSNSSTENKNSIAAISVNRAIDVAIGDVYQKQNSIILKTKINVEKRISLEMILGSTIFLLLSAFSVLLAILSSYVLHQRKVTQRLREAERTAQSKVDRLQRENRHEHASRVYAIGEMAAAIAHELIQPLSSILINSQTGSKLMNVLASSEANVASILASNVKDAQRASEIIRNIHSFVSPKPTDPGYTEINSAIVEVVTLMEATLAEQRFRIVLELDEAPLHCEISRIEIEQVVHNLIRNAVEAGEHLETKDRTVEVSTRNTDCYISVRVRDRGPGIREAMLKDLFLPFSTTKVSGLGLGLSLSRRIVERAGGVISGQNDKNGGAVFEIRLPRATIGMTAATGSGATQQAHGVV